MNSLPHLGALVSHQVPQYLEQRLPAEEDEGGGVARELAEDQCT
jgi:hypothetical protein